MNHSLLKKQILTALLVSVGFCSKPPENKQSVTALFIKGKALIINSAGEHSLKKGDILNSGDVISTGEKSAVIIETGAVSGQLEIQSNSKLKVESSPKGYEFFLEAGNVWVSVNKLSKDQEFKLKTPTTVAGVRGTKFFTFNDGELTGTCHCEGQIEYSNNMSHKSEVNSGDYLVIHKGDKSVTVKEEDFKKAGIKFYGHNHSEMEDSSLGAKNSMTEEEHSKVRQLVAQKFQDLEKK